MSFIFLSKHFVLLWEHLLCHDEPHDANNHCIYTACFCRASILSDCLNVYDCFGDGVHRKVAGNTSFESQRL